MKMGYGRTAVIVAGTVGLLGSMVAPAQARRDGGPIAIGFKLTAPVSPGALDEPAGPRRAFPFLGACGYGHGSPAGPRLEPGASGDTVVLPNRRNGRATIFDSSSPVSLGEHDTLFLQDVIPWKLRLVRHGDNLSLCNDASRFEVLIERHYCRLGRVSDDDLKNNEIEVFIFNKARVIWLTDKLYAHHLNVPHVILPDEEAEEGSPLPEWTVRPFSVVMPEWGRPESCGN